MRRAAKPRASRLRHHWPSLLAASRTESLRGKKETPAASKRMSQGLTERGSNLAAGAGAGARTDGNRPVPAEATETWATPPVAPMIVSYENRVKERLRGTL